MLIWVAGEASGVFGCGEIVSRPLDATAPEGAMSAVTASPAIRYLLRGCIAAEGYAPSPDNPTSVLR
jgi:hypothetical protein